MIKKERLQMERLNRLLEAERKRTEQAWENALYELMDVKMKLERLEKVLRGEDD